MNGTKIINQLSTLSKVELNGFTRYVASPFFNVNQTCIDFLNILSQYYPEFDEAAIRRESIFKKLYPKRKYDEQQLRYAMTDLTRLLEDYLAFQEYSADENLKKHHLINGLFKRKLQKYAVQHQRQAKDLLNKETYRDAKYYQNLLMAGEDTFHLGAASQSRGVDNDLQTLSDNLDRAYLAKKLKYTCEAINRMNVLGEKYDLPFLPSILDYLKNDISHQDIPAITVYYQVLLTLTEAEKPEHYHNLKTVLKENVDKFTILEIRDTWGFAQNYCIRKINTGHSGFLRELFENYQFLLEKEIILDNGTLAQFDFKNIVTIALRLKEFDWTESFIEKSGKLLEATHRLNAITYNKARLQYGKEKHKEALRHLLSVEFTDVYYHLDSKVLLLKIYYELDDYEPLLSLIDTFRVYLRRNKQISDYQKTIYTNFTRFLKKLSRIKLGSKKPVKEIAAEIEAVKQIADLNWLKEKLAELMES